MRDVADPQILPVRLCCILCTPFLTLMFDIYSNLDTWYVVDRERDKDGCGRSQILPVRLYCISCSPSLLLTLMFDIYSHLDIWYVMDRGRDKDGCGRSPESPCNTLLYLLQQVNRTHLPPDNELWIITDKSLVIKQETAVSTVFFNLLFSFPLRRQLTRDFSREPIT